MTYRFELPLKRFLNRGNTKQVVRVIASIPPALIPVIHIACFYYFLDEFALKVDRKRCQCSCWDTVFKGPYENGVASFKHFYFNATSNTWKIWIWTVICLITFYETVKKFITLALDRRLRPRMLILFISAFYSNYYSWWAYVNYWNDNFYPQWYHQLFFTSTELVSTSVVVHLANNKASIAAKKVAVIVVIALTHVSLACIDQFITNVVKREGQSHQVVRDIGFMIPDLLHVVIPLIELKRADQAAFTTLRNKAPVGLLSILIVCILWNY